MVMVYTLRVVLELADTTNRAVLNPLEVKLTLLGLTTRAGGCLTDGVAKTVKATFPEKPSRLMSVIVLLALVPFITVTSA